MRRGALALWRSALGLAALALMLVGCDAAPHSAPTAHRSAQATATAAPPKMLGWRKVSLPPGIPATEDSTGGSMPIAPIVSPVNGHDAWVCAPGNNASFQVWFTKDAGATWRQVSALTPAAPLPITACALTADRGNPDALAVNFGWSSGNGPSVSSGAISYYSSDDGASWRKMPQNVWVSQVATVGATTYATLLDIARGSSASFVASADELASWRAITLSTQAASPNSQFWAANAPGDLLWTPMNEGVPMYSSDGGRSWTTLPAPAGETVQVTVATWQTQPSGWLVCGYLNVATSQDPTENLCTRDLGKSWTVYSVLKNTWACGHCAPDAGPSSGVNPCLASAIAAGGALYSICGNDPQDSGTPWAPWTISRLAPDASTWTTVGLAPCQNINIAQTGQAWCNDARGDATYILDQLP